MKKAVVTFVGLILIILVAIISSFYFNMNFGKNSNIKLLTQPINNIKKMTIQFKGINKDLDNSDKIDSKIINDFYEKVNNTKVRKIKEINSDPQYQIVFLYKDGKLDNIKSTETGVFIYNLNDDGSCFGGKNEELLNYLKNLSYFK